MIKFGTNFQKKGSHLAQANHFDPVLKLKYTCWALPSLVESRVTRLPFKLNIFLRLHTSKGHNKQKATVISFCVIFITFFSVSFRDWKRIRLGKRK